jgi:hypothetical protein
MFICEKQKNYYKLLLLPPNRNCELAGEGDPAVLVPEYTTKIKRKNTIGE